MKKTILEILFLRSLTSNSETIQNRLFRQYAQQANVFDEGRRLVSKASKVNRLPILREVIHRTIALSGQEKEYLLALIYYQMGDLPHSLSFLKKLKKEAVSVRQLKGKVYFELKEMSLIFEEGLADVLNHHEGQQLFYFALSHADMNSAIKVNEQFQLGHGINGMNVREFLQSDISVEKIKEAINYHMPEEIALCLFASQARRNPEKFKEFLESLSNFFHESSLEPLFESTPWRSIVFSKRCIKENNYKQALECLLNAYSLGDRSKYLQSLFYQCFHHSTDFGSIDEIKLKRLVNEGFIPLSHSSSLQVLKGNEYFSYMYQYYPVNSDSKRNFSILVSTLHSFPSPIRKSTFENLAKRVMGLGASKIPLNREALSYLVEGLDQEKEFALKGKWLIENGHSEECYKMVESHQVSTATILYFSDLSYQLDHYGLALKLTNLALNHSMQKPFIYKRLISIHHRIGNLNEKLYYIKKLKKYTGKLLQKEFEIAQDEVYLSAHKWDWEPKLNSTNEKGDSILHVLNKSVPEINGYTIRSREIIESQKQLGWNPVVVTKLGWCPSSEEKGHTNTYEGIDYIRLSKGKMRLNTVPLTEYFNQYANELEKVVNETHPKAIHAASNFQNALPALVVGKKKGIETVYEVRGFWHDTTASKVPEFNESERYRLHEQYEVYCCQIADKVVAIGESLKDQLITLGVPKEKITVITNGVDCQTFSPIPKNKDLIKRWNLENKTVYGFIGSVTHYEGLDLAFKALVDIKEKGVPFHFVLVGDGPALKDLKELSVELALENHITFIGRVPASEVKEYYSIIDIFPFPRTKAKVCALVTPLKPYEVMAMGKLALVSDIPALNEMVTEGENGFIFEPENVESLVQCLLYARDHLDVGERSREWVKENRNWSSMVHQYKEVYQTNNN
ncbi:glycosyltransferase [Bacillus sp. NTK074B]|uniref:glycosyltransferase family 4 protein n=1 Tax=Bacillus sp. NTK074B TaxID=2802174 RepID=UPI001A8FD68B|nr:glycosyltransferase [Bacillus sp. NTK074B]